MFEIWTFITSRKLDFVPDGKGEADRVKGVQLFLCRPSTDHGWCGFEISKFFIRDGSDVLSKPLPNPGTDIRIAFNRFGKISLIEEV